MNWTIGPLLTLIVLGLLIGIIIGMKIGGPETWFVKESVPSFYNTKPPVSKVIQGDLTIDSSYASIQDCEIRGNLIMNGTHSLITDCYIDRMNPEHPYMTMEAFEDVLKIYGSFYFKPGYTWRFDDVGLWKE
ncbi:MAG: hypothetical protein KAR20_14850 [Candidatus Heimdallarchaeota archaeon]|nr:hypothetical protein [Candidatus Heimdallarchaeota archaeon]